MSKEINIPLYRAKKINSDEYVIGYLTVLGLKDLSCMYCIETEYIRDGEYIISKKREVEVTTLEVSFSSGVTWFSLECVNSIMNSDEIIGIQE